MDHLILFDFAVHWFDLVSCLMTGRNPNKVYASAVRHSGQLYNPRPRLRRHRLPERPSSDVLQRPLRSGRGGRPR